MKKKIAFVATVPFAVNNFIKPNIDNLKKNFKVYVLTNLLDSKNIDLKKNLKNVIFIHINFKRNISLFNDLQSFISLLKFFIITDIDYVHTITPKAGLLGITASFFAKVPIRIHTFTGQIWANYSTFKKSIFIFFDKMIIYFSTSILVDGIPQLEFLKMNNFFKKLDPEVILNGSICGVDTNKFIRDIYCRKKIRDFHSIKNNEIVILFLGRINHDKGVITLLKAFNECFRDNKKIKLLLCGPIEDHNCINYLNNLDTSIKKNVITTEYVSNAEQYMSASDIFCLPSYREGFGQVVIEASSCCLPVVVSNIYGLSDSFINNITGLNFEVGSVKSLKQKLLSLINNKSKRLFLGKQGRLYVRNKFEQKKIVKGLEDFYLRKWKENNEELS